MTKRQWYRTRVGYSTACRSIAPAVMTGHSLIRIMVSITRRIVKSDFGNRISCNIVQLFRFTTRSLHLSGVVNRCPRNGFCIFIKDNCKLRQLVSCSVIIQIDMNKRLFARIGDCSGLAITILRISENHEAAVTILGL